MKWVIIGVAALLCLGLGVWITWPLVQSARVDKVVAETKTTTAVVQGTEVQAVGKAESKTNERQQVIVIRTEKAAAAIRSAGPDPDVEFIRSMCDSPLFTSDPGCNGGGRGPEGGNPK